MTTSIRNQWLRRLAIITQVLFLTACGGGGGGDARPLPNTPPPPPPPPPVLSGKFKDFTVSGLSYSSGQQMGVTDAAGTFRCETGGDVAFAIGAVDLGATALRHVCRAESACRSCRHEFRAGGCEQIALPADAGSRRRPGQRHRDHRPGSTGRSQLDAGRFPDDGSLYRADDDHVGCRIGRRDTTRPSLGCGRTDPSRRHAGLPIRRRVRRLYLGWRERRCRHGHRLDGPQFWLRFRSPSNGRRSTRFKRYPCLAAAAARSRCSTCRRSTTTTIQASPDRSPRCSSTPIPSWAPGRTAT